MNKKAKLERFWRSEGLWDELMRLEFNASMDMTGMPPYIDKHNSAYENYVLKSVPIGILDYPESECSPGWAGWWLSLSEPPRSLE